MFLPLEAEGVRFRNPKIRSSVIFYVQLVEKFRITVTANGKRHFVPAD